MKYTYIFIIAFVIIIVLIITSKGIEKFENVDINDLKKKVDSMQVDLQAIQGISSIYNTGNMKLTNLEVTGTLKVDGSITGPLKVDDEIHSLKNITVDGDIHGLKSLTIDGEVHGLRSFSADGGFVGAWENISGEINIGSNANIGGKITVKNGGDFSGGRYYFNDEENCGKLRVGCAWNAPAIFNENIDKPLKLGSQSGWIDTENQNLAIGQQLKIGNNFIGEQPSIDEFLRIWANGNPSASKWISTAGKYR